MKQKRMIINYLRSSISMSLIIIITYIESSNKSTKNSKRKINDPNWIIQQHHAGMQNHIILEKQPFDRSLPTSFSTRVYLPTYMLQLLQQYLFNYIQYYIGVLTLTPFSFYIVEHLSPPLFLSFIPSSQISFLFLFVYLWKKKESLIRIY